MALRLHAITVAESEHHVSVTKEHPAVNPAEPLAAGPTRTAKPSRVTGIYGGPDAVVPFFTLVAFRDLCAVVSEQGMFGLDELTPDVIAQHRSIVDSVFRHAAVLPAPVGVVFRAPDVLKRWMELHYVSLTDALQFVEDRAVARVHIVRADGRVDELEAGSDLAAAAAESLRALRRKAVASVPLRLEEVTGLALSASFLIERDLWKDFQNAVEEQRDAHARLRFDVTGPWAPYDFVRMQFGG